MIATKANAIIMQYVCKNSSSQLIDQRSDTYLSLCVFTTQSYMDFRDLVLTDKRCTSTLALFHI